MNLYLEEYNFMRATTIIHNFILYDICDVYIEAIKPIISSQTNGEHDKDTKSTMVGDMTKQVLYTVIDQSLKCLHPFMPFITEELYQRLPRRPNEEGQVETISLTAYPTEVIYGWIDE